MGATAWQKRFISALVMGPIAFSIIWNGGWLYVWLLFVAAVICIYEWVQLSLKSPYKILLIIVGIVYIGLSFWTCYLIRKGPEGAENALAFAIMIWASDTGAYLTGKSIGGAKMSPTISPKKTWAGFAGAIFFPGICFILIFLAHNYTTDIVFKMPETIFFVLVLVLGGVVGFVGQAGDLIVSLFKRHVQVKDAGQLIPGHGGLLDRVDSMMLAAPVYYGIIKWMSKFVVS